MPRLQSIKTKVTICVFALFLLTSIIFTYDSVTRMKIIANDITDTLYRERINGYLNATEKYVAQIYGEISLRDSVIVDINGRAIDGNYELVDAIHFDTGLYATIYARQNDRFKRISTSIERDGNRISQTILGADHPIHSLLESIKPGERTIKETTVMGVPYLTGTLPLFTETNEIYGALVIGVPLTYIETTIKEKRDLMIKYMLFLAVGLSISFCIIILFLLNHFFLPIHTTTNLLKKLAEKGANLQTRLDVKSKNEMGDLAFYFNKILDEVYDIVQHIIKNAKSIHEKSRELSNTANLLIANAVHMNDRSLLITAKIEEMSLNSDDIINLSEGSCSSANTVAYQSEELSSIVNDLAVITEQTNADVHTTLEAIEKFDELINIMQNNLDIENLDTLKHYSKTITMYIKEAVIVFDCICKDSFTAAKSSNQITSCSEIAKQSSEDISKLTVDIKKNLTEITKNMMNMQYDIHNTTMQAEITKKVSDELNSIADELDKKTVVFTIE